MNRLTQTHQPIIGFDFKPKKIGAFRNADAAQGADLAHLPLLRTNTLAPHHFRPARNLSLDMRAHMFGRATNGHHR